MCVCVCACVTRRGDVTSSVVDGIYQGAINGDGMQVNLKLDKVVESHSLRGGVWVGQDV